MSIPQSPLNLSEEDVDGDLQTTDGAEEAFHILQPYAISPDLCDPLKDRLKSLGVTNLSHISKLKESDFDQIISPIQFRTMLEEFKSKNSSPSNQNCSTVRYKLNLKELHSKKFYQTLQDDKEILTKQDRKKLVNLIADDIRETVQVIHKKEVLQVSLAIVKAHPTSLGCLMKDETDEEESASVLCTSLLNHIFYIKSQHKGKRSASCNVTGAKRSRFSNAQNNGLEPERDLPNSLPEGETCETQESKRMLMVNLANSGAPINWLSVRKMMSETYYSQRGDINDQMSMEKLLSKWPFIGKHCILQEHFEEVKNVKVSDAVINYTGDFFSSLEQFFEAECHKKRKGKCANIPLNLKKIIKKYREEKEVNPSKLYICIILCCLMYIIVPNEEIFICFEETASFDDIQASDVIPSHPVIAVLGDNVQDNPQAFVLVDKRIISEEQICFSKAINALFMCYYVFKIAYPTKSAPILHFLQRKVFGIIDDGSKTQRTKTAKGYIGAPPPVPNPLLSLMKSVKQYCSEWNLTF